MRPKQPEGDLFRARLHQFINIKHERCRLHSRSTEPGSTGEVAPLYSDKGRPGIVSRFVIGLLLFNTSTPSPTRALRALGLRSLLPARALRLSHWRKRLGGKLELLLAQSLRVGIAGLALLLANQTPFEGLSK